MSGVYSALSGALAQSSSLEVTATNLANANTAGYRALRPVFHEVLSRTGGDDKARFSVLRQTAVDTTPGNVRQTDRALDVVLPQDAFLAVKTPAGERYTRAGSLELTGEGALVTRQGGMPVLGESGQPLQLGTPSGEVTISKTGEVQVAGVTAGILRVVSFERPDQMTYEGSNLLAANAEAGAPTVSTKGVEVGHLEHSNASPVRAMSDMMMATRVFEAMERAIDTFGQVDRKLVSSVMKVG